MEDSTMPTPIPVDGEGLERALQKVLASMVART
jgi:hypothetical protein